MRAGGANERQGLFASLGRDEIVDAFLRDNGVDEAAAHGLRRRLHGFQSGAAAQFRLLSLRNAGSCDPHLRRKLRAGHAQSFADGPQPALRRRSQAGMARGAIGEALVLQPDDGFDAHCQFAFLWTVSLCQHIGIR